MPKPLHYEGLIAAVRAGERVLAHCGLTNHPVARARVGQRLVRSALERRPALAVWVGGRLYILDEPATLDALADETGLLQPPVTANSAHADGASPSSSMAVA
jgi:hypothetical protein